MDVMAVYVLYAVIIKDKKLSNGKLMEACRALVHCSGYNEERRGMMEIGSE